MYTLKSLPFEMFSLEPFIDTHTIGLHHYKHELSYLNNLNKIIAKYNMNYKLEELYKHLDEFKDEDKNDLIFYLGGVINHELFGNQLIQIIRRILKVNYLMPLIKNMVPLITFGWNLKTL